MNMRWDVYDYLGNQVPITAILWAERILVESFKPTQRLSKHEEIQLTGHSTPTKFDVVEFFNQMGIVGRSRLRAPNGTIDANKTNEGEYRIYENPSLPEMKHTKRIILCLPTPDGKTIDE
jgi:hypothetical protein